MMFRPQSKNQPHVKAAYHFGRKTYSEKQNIGHVHIHGAKVAMTVWSLPGQNDVSLI